MADDEAQQRKCDNNTQKIIKEIRWQCTTHLPYLFELFFKTPAVVRLRWVGSLTWCRWIRACLGDDEMWRNFINHLESVKIEFNIYERSPSLLLAVDGVVLKGNPFDDSWLCDDEFCRLCAALKFKLFCKVLVNDGWSAEKSRTCILIFSRTSLCWKFWKFCTPMLSADKLLSMPRAWFVGNGVSLESWGKERDWNESH